MRYALGTVISETILAHHRKLNVDGTESDSMGSTGILPRLIILRAYRACGIGKQFQSQSCPLCASFSSRTYGNTKMITRKQRESVGAESRKSSYILAEGGRIGMNR